jgi:hypothetical protein
MLRTRINFICLIAVFVEASPILAAARPSEAVPCDKACLQKKTDALFRYLDETPTCDNACRRKMDALMKDIERAKRSSGSDNETSGKTGADPVI